MSIRPRQLSRIGMFYLQEAVLDVLYAHYLEKHGLGPAEISKRADIYRERGVKNTLNDAIVWGLLNSLHAQGKVRQVKQKDGKGGWKLTDTEYSRRKEDL